VEKSEIEGEARRRLEAFRIKAEKRMCRYWKTPEELGGVVSRSYIKLIKSHAAVGWVKADDAIPIETQAELAKLRNEITDLRTQLSNARTSAPEGTDRLAQGHDRMAVNYEVAVRPPDRPKISRQQIPLELTWNEIFSELGPLMLEESTESKLQNHLQRYAGRLLSRVGRLPAGAMLAASIPNDEFQTIKLQLIALGLIRRSEKRRTVSDTNTYWALTPYGEAQLLNLRAIQRTPAEEASSE
jgi:hypothetical protein